MRNSEAINYSNIFKERITQSFSQNNQKEREASIMTNILFMNNEENFFPRETLTSIYGDNYDSVHIKWQNAEREKIDYFSLILDELKNKYNEFNINMNSHLNEVTNKIANVFKLNNQSEDIKDFQRNSLIQKYSNEYLEQLNKILDMHEQIFTHIKDSISIFFKFLDITKILDKKKPIQEFINKEFNNIIQNWLFLKINLENYNFAKAINKSELDDDFKNFIFKICKDKNYVMDITSRKEYMLLTKKNFDYLNDENKFKINKQMEIDEKIMEDNSTNLVKLTMNNIYFADKYFDNKIKYQKMHSLKLDNVTFEEKRNNDTFLENIPNLENLIINSSTNFEINLLKSLSNKLIKLELTKNGFVDFEFENIMENYLVKSSSIRKNLQILSFSYNNLSNIDISQFVYQPKQSFYSLKELNFEKNKIFKFSILPEFFVELKCINCCYNCFTRSYFEQYQNILTLLCGNIYLSKISLAEKYFTSLEKKLNNSNFSLTYLNISYIPKKLSNEYISNLIINDSILINLKKLDLRHNNLYNKTIIKFFENNKGCLSLKYLNLSYNNLDDLFFEKYLNLNLNNLFNKLKYIHLDSNKFGTYNIINTSKEAQKLSNILFDINNEKEIMRLKLLYRFILENKNLVEITLVKNPMNNKYIIQNIKDNAQSFNVDNFIKKDDNKNVVINGLLSFLWKIKTEINGDENTRVKEIRPKFNLKFDCVNSYNNNSCDFDFTKKFITFNNKK